MSIEEAGGEIGDDGMYCRPSGDWARIKHRFLSHFGPLALEATLGARRPKRTAAYVDLYAGPGVCIERGSRSRFFGSPLAAVQMRSPRGFAFTEAHLVNKSVEEHRVLDARLDALESAGRLSIPRDRIFTYRGDANVFVHPILEQIHPRAYVFVFADPARPNDLQWSTIEALHRYRDHTSVDLYSLFPLHMALLRMLGYSSAAREPNAEATTRFFGDDSWRQCELLRANQERRLDFARCLTDTYLTRLRTLWKHADAVVTVHRRGIPMYKMCFASNHDAGRDIARWAKSQTSRSDQPSLGDGF